MQTKYLFILIGLLSAGTLYGQNGTTGPLTWEISDEILTISGNGDMPDYTVDGDAPWFIYRNAITGLIIEEGVTSIGDEAFRGSSIHTVSIPGTVKTIGIDAFHDCTNLVSLDIPDMLTTIGGYSFYNCKSLSSVSIGSGVSYIGAYIFSGCTSLPAIDVSEDNNNFLSENGILFSKDKTSIRQYPAAKEGTSYAIPDGVTLIYPDAFDSCSKLSSVILPNSVIYIGNWAFCGCSSLKSITIPNGVTTIGTNVFANCENLTSVIFPASLTDIGKYTFLNCNNLSELVNFNPEPQQVTDVFRELQFDGCILRVPAASVSAYQTAEDWDQFKNIVALETGLTLEFDKKELFLLKDESSKITVSIEYLTLMNMIWNSIDETVATVSNTGMVTAISAGIAEIKATIPGLQAICGVTVIELGRSTISGSISDTEAGNVRAKLYMKTK